MMWEVGRVYRTRVGRLVRIESSTPLSAKALDDKITYFFNSIGESKSSTELDLMELVREQHEANALASSKSGAPSK
jgi:hypothetical protein